MDGLKNLNLLFLEDNKEFAKNTKSFLDIYFKKVLHVKTIKDAIFTYNTMKIDAIISDIKIENSNGLDFIIDVRNNNSTIPIIVLSAHKDEDFLFKAIPLNIMSYELKPISYDNFITLLKKLSLIFEPKDITILPNGFKYNFKYKELTTNRGVVSLTKKESLFIELLINNKTEITTNDVIQRDVWEDTIMSNSAIKNLIFRLRKKINSDFITTVNGIGYKLS